MNSKNNKNQEELKAEKQSKEKNVVALMVGLYCQKNHKTKKAMKNPEFLCPECKNLLSYVHDRVEHCPFTQTKSFCSACPVHCYKPEMREKIRQVMHFSGPKMIFYHPVLAIRHLKTALKMKKSQKKQQKGQLH